MGRELASVRRRILGQDSTGGDELGRSYDQFLGQWHDGHGCFVYPTTRFKSVTIYAAWIRELTVAERALGALLPSVLRRGTHSFPDRQKMEQRLENLYGASFRADVGKLGDKQIISFVLNVVNGKFLPGHPDTVQDGLDFLTEVLESPHLSDEVFDADVVSQEKALLERHIMALINDKGQYAMSRLMELVAGEHRFGLQKLGRIEDVKAIDAEGLTRFYQRVKDEAPFFFAAVGDVDPEDMMGRVERRWPGTRTELAPIAPYRGQHDGQTIVESQDVRQAKLNLAYRTGITARDADFPALVMYSGLLGGFSHSKLFVNVREKASLAYYAYSRIDPALAIMTIGAGIEFTDYEAARRIIDEQVEAMAKGQFSGDEMAYTLKAYTNDILSEGDNASQLIGRRLEEQLIGAGWWGPRLIEALQKVRRDDVMRVAEQVALDTVFFLTAQKQEEVLHEG